MLYTLWVADDSGKEQKKIIPEIQLIFKAPIS